MDAYVKQEAVKKEEITLSSDGRIHINETLWPGISVWLWDTLKERLSSFEGKNFDLCGESGTKRRIEEAKAAMMVTNTFKEEK